MHTLKCKLFKLPSGYIKGYQHFYEQTLYTHPQVFIPRSDTECLIRDILANTALLPDSILDLGTGSGAIAIALSKALPSAQVHATDINVHAINLARNNAYLNKADVKVWYSNWFSHIDQTYDLIVSNPPYIDISENVGTEVLFEPANALYAPDQGYRYLMDIIFQSYHHYLNSGGSVVLEHGYNQGEKIIQYMNDCGYTGVRAIYDLHHIHRATVGIKP